MGKLYYCIMCKRILNNRKICKYCKSCKIKQLKVGEFVNVIGTEIRGNFIRVKGNNARIIIENKEKKIIKTYTADKLKKIV